MRAWFDPCWISRTRVGAQAEEQMETKFRKVVRPEWSGSTRVFPPTCVLGIGRSSPRGCSTLLSGVGGKTRGPHLQLHSPAQPFPLWNPMPPAARSRSQYLRKALDFT